MAAYIPGGLEHSFEEFAQARAEQEDANRGTGRGKTAEEINEKYDSEFVGHLCRAVDLLNFREFILYEVG